MKKVESNREELRALVEVIAKYLVDNPQSVSVRQHSGDHTTVIELKVDKTDLGKVIGKQGKTAQSIRTLLNGAGNRLRIRAVLEIIE